jgi:hypothetical protein
MSPHASQASQHQRAESGEQRADPGLKKNKARLFNEGNELPIIPGPTEAESRAQRAESRERRADNREQGAESSPWHPKNNFQVIFFKLRE